MHITHKDLPFYGVELPEKVYNQALALSEVTRNSVEYSLLAGQLALWYREQARLSPEQSFRIEKKDGTALTAADIYCLYQFIWYHRRRNPESLYFGEEDLANHPSYSSLSDSVIPHHQYWKVVREKSVLVIDSINNTEDFQNNGTNWDVTVSEFRNGRVCHGVVYAPQLDNTVGVGERGVGAYLSRGRELNFRPVEPRKWDGKYSHLRVGHGHSIVHSKRYRRLMRYLDEKGVKTREIVSSSGGLLAACEEIDVYIHGFTFAWDIAGGLGILEPCGRVVQLIRDTPDGPRLLPGFDPPFFNPDRNALCTEVIGGEPAAVEWLTGLWLKFIKGSGVGKRRAMAVGA